MVIYVFSLPSGFGFVFTLLLLSKKIKLVTEISVSQA